MICSGCGVKLKEDALFCPLCGMVQGNTLSSRSRVDRERNYSAYLDNEPNKKAAATAPERREKSDPYGDTGLLTEAVVLHDARDDFWDVPPKEESDPYGDTGLLAEVVALHDTRDDFWDVPEESDPYGDTGLLADDGHPMEENEWSKDTQEAPKSREVSFSDETPDDDVASLWDMIPVGEISIFEDRDYFPEESKPDIWADIPTVPEENVWDKYFREESDPYGDTGLLTEEGFASAYHSNASEESTFEEDPFPPESEDTGLLCDYDVPQAYSSAGLVEQAPPKEEPEDKTVAPIINGRFISCPLCGFSGMRPSRRVCFTCGAVFRISPWTCRACEKENNYQADRCFHCEAPR